jgi:hypothetical protein
MGAKTRAFCRCFRGIAHGAGVVCSQWRQRLHCAVLPPVQQRLVDFRERPLSILGTPPPLEVKGDNRPSCGLCLRRRRAKKPGDQASSHVMGCDDMPGMFLTYRLRLTRWPAPLAPARHVGVVHNAPPVHGCSCGGKRSPDGAPMRRHQAQDWRTIGGCDARQISNAGQTLRPMRANAHHVPALSGWPVLARVMLARGRTTAGERGTPCTRTHPHPGPPGASDAGVILRILP